MNESSTKICCKNLCHEAKLVSIFPTNFLLQGTNSSPALPAFWGWVCSGEKSEVLYLMFKIRIKRNKARNPSPALDLKLYNVMSNIWITTSGKS